ncbi:hypothetical protein F443_22652 [Phytophthora nicotianae P1569]|uniref:Uncharacterized protein n=1 Tax=Phytophthora nicotianae P1569 TaxID=1317065 RepID=V9DTK4_PHYNI|nr:hypothetical protein F443_22652 [Phytophthora nicotianae P1569]
MQNNSVDVELQRTLNELCTDLFATAVLDDCSAILQSLALLAEAFPQAQSLIGRLLIQPPDNQDRPRYSTVSKLSLLSTNFLYKKETVRSAVSLLAVLANNNLRNQRRIVQHVAGVKLPINPSKRGALAAESNLYALTVPATVTTTYRRWKKRQQELHNCRLPSGTPPCSDGTPMPCYCDDCLGAEQFLSTWQQHFHDLSRWTLDPDRGTGTSSSKSLSTEEFFHMFLEDNQLRVCSVGNAVGNEKKMESSCTNRHRSVVYYFVSLEEAANATPRTPVQFNPLRHVSAIAIAAEIDIAATRKAQVQSVTISNESSSLELEESSALATDQVILFTGTSDIESCRSAFPENKEASSISPNQAMDNNERLLYDFLRFEEQHGQLAQCGSLVSDVSEDSDVVETTRRVLHCMLDFCESTGQIPLSAFRRSFCRSVDSNEPLDDSTASCEMDDIKSASLNVKVTMTAILTEQALQIDCTGITRSSCTFSTRIPQQELLENSTGDRGNLSLLCLSDEALENLIQRCRICMCETQETHEDDDSVFYLQPSTPDEESLQPSDDEVSEGPVVAHSEQQDCAVHPPLCGLSPEAKRVLTKLETVVSQEKYRKLTCDGFATVMKKLSNVVADCNKRISYLSTTRDKELVVAVTQVHRTAAISRCRHCRNLLIQLGKKMALKATPFDTSAPISHDKLLHIAKLVRSSIQSVLVHSESFDPWEIPDARVENLQLDHRVWASGYPDAAFYQDTDARRRQNRKKQQQLSRKLLQKKKKANGQAREIQHKSVQA